MKKLLFVLPTVVLLAAGCGHAQAPAAQNSSSQAQEQNIPANKYSSINVPPPTSQYSSSLDGFSANFPTSPKITQSSFYSPSAGAIPLTQYRQTFSNGSQYAFYTIYVYHYPANYKFANDYLASAATSYVKVLSDMYPGTQLVSQQQTRFLGNSAITGIISVPLKLNQGGGITQTADYFLATVKGQNTYVISAYGMDQSNFTAFTNSFKFQ